MQQSSQIFRNSVQIYTSKGYGVRNLSQKPQNTKIAAIQSETPNGMTPDGLNTKGIANVTLKSTNR